MLGSPAARYAVLMSVNENRSEEAMAMDLTSLTPQQGIGNDQLFADDVGSLLEAVEGKKQLPYFDGKGIYLETPSLTIKKYDPCTKATTTLRSGT